jgi:membrane protein
MLIGLGGFVVLVMVASMIWSGVEQAIQPAIQLAPWLEWVTSIWINLILNWIAFTIIYKVVPKPRIHWREALHGGALASLLWEAGRQALALYILRLNYPSAYGIIGSFLAVMLWAYYASLVVLFGAEYVRVITEEARESQQMRITMPDE